MRLRSVGFIFLMALVTVAEAEVDYDVRIPGAPGVEYLVKGNLGGPDPYYGHSIVPGTRSVITKLVQGREVHQITVTVDAHRFRTSSATGRPHKKEHLIVADGSVAFGDGLDDEQTITHFINQLSPTFEAYQLGFLGYGPQHTWLRMKEGLLPQQIPHKQGHFVMLTGLHDFHRFFGTLDHLPYAADHPLVLEDSSGQFVRRGLFSDSGTWVQKAAVKYCIPIAACKAFLTKLKSEGMSKERWAVTGRLINAIESMYREQFQAKSFTVLWQGPKSEIRELQKYTAIPIQVFHDYPRQDDGHPSGEGAKQIAEQILKVIESASTEPSR